MSEQTIASETNMGVMDIHMRDLEGALRFPPDCSIVSLSYDVQARIVHLLLSSPVIPQAGDYQPLPSVSLRYTTSVLDPDVMVEHPETYYEYRKITSELQVL